MVASVILLQIHKYRYISYGMKTRIFKYFKLLLISLFLVTRFSALAHASEYGNGPHEHNGKICVLAIATDDDHDEIALLPGGFSLPLISTKSFVSPALDVTPLFSPPVFACMRGPPSLKSTPNEQ